MSIQKYEQRYEVERGGHIILEMQPAPHGDWVLYTDHLSSVEAARREARGEAFIAGWESREAGFRKSIALKEYIASAEGGKE